MSAILLWNLVVKSSLVVGLAVVASIFLRRSSASRRHVVWLATVLSLMLLPVAEVRLPVWDVHVDKAPITGALIVPRALDAISSSTNSDLETIASEPSSVQATDHRA